MLRRRSLALLAATLLLLVAAEAQGTVMVALDLQRLLARADLVAVVTVIDQRARWDSRRRIVTDVTIRLDEVIKGDDSRGSRVVLRRLGGVVGDLGMRVVGEPTFEDGGQVLLFAMRRSGSLRPVGMSQGVMPIRADALGRDVVLPAGAGLSLVRRQADGALREALPALPRARLLGELVDELRRRMDAMGAP